MNSNEKILILGSRGMVGSAITRELQATGYGNLLTPSKDDLDLTSQDRTLKYFKKEKPSYVFLAAAKVGGIVANDTYRADFLFENLSIQNNVFEACFKENVEKLLFLGSSCIYPKESPQPIKEEYLLTGPLEQTNEPYAIAKIAGLKMAENFKRQYGKNFVSVMPTNLYGENDNFDLQNSHVIPGLIARMNLAKENKEKTFSIWGSGKPRREFLYVDDMAKACITVMKSNQDLPYFLNIGTGQDISIGELANLIAEELCYEGELIFDTSKPDGTIRKLLDVSKIESLGWSPTVELREGIKRSISFYLNAKNVRK